MKKIQSRRFSLSQKRIMNKKATSLGYIWLENERERVLGFLEKGSLEVVVSRRQVIESHFL